MKTLPVLLMAATVALAAANAASAYHFNPPDASVHLHGKMTFTPNEGGSPFTCNVTMELKTKHQHISAIKFPKGNCHVTLNDFPWGVAILKANSGEILNDGYFGNGTCNEMFSTFQVDGSGTWTLPPGQCFSGTFKSNPPTTIVP